MNISDLKPNPQNPRQISDKKLEILKKSLAEFGDLSGVVFNKRTCHLVGGHQRMKVIPQSAQIEMIDQEHGFITCDGIKQTYRVVEWDETKEKAANIAANKHGGDWDIPKLNEWLLELDAQNIDMDLTGFTQEELEGLMAPVQKLEPQCDEDEVPEHVEPKTKRGDIYKLGRHRLMCGDSTSIDDVEKLMAGEKADMVFTDPPYGMNLDTDYSKADWKSKSGDDNKGRTYNKIIGDDQDFDPGIIFGLFDYCKEIFLWGADYYCQSLPKNGAWFVWDKRRSDNFEVKETVDNLFGSHFELCWSKQKHKREVIRFYRAFGAAEGGMEDRNKGGTPVTYHPTQKPIGLIVKFLEKFSEPKFNIVDLFGGSGSTLIACEKTNRICFMMELDPHYCDVIVARWEKYTGQKSELLNG